MADVPVMANPTRAPLVRLGLWMVATSLLVSPARAGGSVTLSVVGFHRVTEGLGTEWRAWVGLTVPFDRIAGAESGLAQDAAPADASPGASGARPTYSPTDDRPAQARSAPDGRDSLRELPKAWAPRTAPPLSPELARETVRVVLQAQGAGASRRRLDSLAIRANTSAWLPQLRVQGGRTTLQSLRLNNTTGTSTGAVVQTGGNNFYGQVRLTWNLDRLVFASDELSVERLRGQRAGARMKLVARVFETLLRWHRARVRAGDPALLPEERDAAELDQLEAELWLDVMSDGWFSRRAARVSQSP